MVVLKRLIMLILLFTTLVSCTEDQFIEITPTDYDANPIMNHIGTWVLDSVKITTKEHPVQEGVAYQVLMWIPEPDKKDTLNIINEYQLSWTKYQSVLSYSLLNGAFDIIHFDTLTYKLQTSSGDALSFSSTGVYSTGGGGEKRLVADSLKIDSLFYFSNPNYYEVSFANDLYDPIIYNNGDGKCMNCHNAETFYPLKLEPIETAYYQLVNGFSLSNEPYVDTLNPSQSHLYKRLIGDGYSIMPPNGSLTAEEIELFYLWIKQGAKNN